MELAFLTAALCWELTFSCSHTVSQAFTSITSSTDRAARQAWPMLRNLPLGCFKTTHYVLVPTLTFLYLVASIQLLQNLLIWYHSSFLKIKTQCKTVSNASLEPCYVNSFYIYQPNPYPKCITSPKVTEQFYGFFSVNA